jgi:hypothetical protein
MSSTKFRLQAMREVAEQADDKVFYDEAEKLGKDAAISFTSRHRKQITDLEEVVNSAMKVTDVLNHIKNQTARREPWREFGPALLKTIQNDLNKRRDNICDRLTLSSDEHEQNKQKQQVHLYLIREFVRQLAAQYEYQCMQTDRGIKV